MKPILSIVLLLSALQGAVGAMAADDGTENKQALATSPQALVDMLENVSFMTPQQYREKLYSLRAAHAFPIGLEQLRQNLDESADPRRDITAKQMAAYAGVLADIARESKNDGEILWGRIQGTKYERKAHQWIYKELQSFGLDDVHYDRFPSAFPQWRPTTSDLEITTAPGFESTQRYSFKEAITAFVSATTPKGGIEAEVIYVGDGTAAELQGRDINDKIVLLRGRTQPSALNNSARTAYSRLVTGKYGKPAGIVVWWDVPRTAQVAGRVGAPGGGDDIGRAAPWTSIGNDAGLYLRKLLDRATPDNPVMVRLDVQGQIESGEQRVSGNVYAMLPGQSGDYVVIPTHVDGYFYGIHDNGSSVALNLALAKHYAQIPLEKRQHGLVFLFQGDHEVPGVGGTLPFIDKHRKLMQEHLLLVLRPEHLGMMRPLDEAIYIAHSNVTDPLMLLVSNRSPALIEIFKRAATNYSIPMGDLVYSDPAADEAAFHPPYNKFGAISSGWITTGKFYHSTADVDWGGINFKQMEKIARAHAYVIDELFTLEKAELQRGGYPPPEKSIYQSDLLKIMMGNN
ncbi:MAG: M28 family peptidase [Pseudomonadales bacterium]